MAEWLTVQEVCALAGVSRRTVYYWVKAGKVDYTRTVGGAVRIGRASLRRPVTGSAVRAALEDVVYQFGYPTVVDGQPALTSGGLSALAGAFAALGWSDPYVIPEPVWCDAPTVPRCPRPTTTGIATPDGYKRYCTAHTPPF